MYYSPSAHSHSHSFMHTRDHYYMHASSHSQFTIHTRKCLHNEKIAIIIIMIRRRCDVIAKTVNFLPHICDVIRTQSALSCPLPIAQFTFFIKSISSVAHIPHLSATNKQFHCVPFACHWQKNQKKKKTPANVCRGEWLQIVFNILFFFIYNSIFVSFIFQFNIFHILIVVYLQAAHVNTTTIRICFVLCFCHSYAFRAPKTSSVRSNWNFIERSAIWWLWVLLLLLLLLLLFVCLWVTHPFHLSLTLT